MSFHFEVLGVDGQARAGIFHTPHGSIPTPVFAPVGTQATVKAIPPKDLRELSASLILANTYHLHLRPGDALIRDLGGLHHFMAWDGPILTDSGGYQVFSLTQINKIDDDGVTFRSHIDGSAHRFTPESAVRIEQNLGADIIMCFDECPPPTDRSRVEKAVERTSRWALRCRETHPDDSHQALFGIVQGGIFEDQRAKSSEALLAIGFPGYAVGGLAVGESKAEMAAALDFTVPMLPEDRPRYLMGVGDPDDLVAGILRGIDIFDCVLPTRLARHGSVLTHEGRINMRNAQNATLDIPIEAECSCYCCQNFSRAYLRHLIVAKELLSHYLLSIHNIHFLIQHVSRMRAAILRGELASYAEGFLRRYRVRQ